MREDAADAYGVCALDVECPASHLCVEGLCKKLCESAEDCGWADARCLSKEGGSFSVCTSGCDLTTPSRPRRGLTICGRGARCDVVQEDGGGRYTDCSVAAGSIADGEECTDDADCTSGSFCTAGVCQRSCTEEAATCSAGMRCGAFVADAGQDVGRCCTVPGGRSCDLATDCGCPLGQTCFPTGPESTSCRPVDPAALAPYAACSSDAQCPARHLCLGRGVSGDFQGTCKRTCGTDADCDAEGTSCVSFGTSQGETVVAGGACLRGCDPVSPQAPATGFRACGPGATCLPAGADFDCFYAGAGVPGSPCTTVRPDCSAGLFCLRGTCTPACEVGGKGCEEGLSCGSLTRLGERTIGACCAVPEGQACDWASDCGCGLNETCAATLGVTSCRAVREDAVFAYASCARDSECPAFHSCVEGACRRRCGVSADCPQADAVCIPLADAPEQGGVCARNCDVLSPSAPAEGFGTCGDGLSCAHSSTAIGSFITCVTPGGALEGATCSSTPDCALGLTCEVGLCSRYCTMGSTCADGSACAPLAIAAPVIGGRELGSCPALPAGVDAPTAE